MVNKKFFYLIIILFTIILLSNCSEKHNKSKKNLSYNTKADTEQIISLIEEYYTNFEKKDADSILKLFSKNGDSSLYKKEYYDTIFKNVNKIKFDISKNDITSIDKNRFEAKINSTVTLTFNASEHINNFTEKFIIIQEDNKWRIWKRITG